MTSENFEKIDVDAVNKKEKRSLYKKRTKIHPKKARGGYRQLKWILMTITLAIYYITPWIRWERPGIAPDQAVLVDFVNQRFYFFFIEIWPQEIYYITGLLILSALSLFLVTALFGRAWCGYACPQTVWTDLYIAVERWTEGDRNARLKLDKMPISVDKIRKRVVKHTTWLLIALCTGGAWVFYFADAPLLFKQLVRGEASSVAYISVAILTATTYIFGGWMREQVCTYMCPWPRIQGAMVDEQTLTVTYHAGRGEPRAKHKKGSSWENAGHCVDCNQCVAVCPMGIDIRDGLQLECITCALCIDACDGVMDKIDLPHGLISYDTHAGQFDKTPGKKLDVKFLRPRIIGYALIVLMVSIVMTTAMINRSVLDISIIRDRNPLFVTLGDGSIRNGYTVKITNKLLEPRHFNLAVKGLEGANIWHAEMPEALTFAPVTVPADGVFSFRIFISILKPELDDGSHDFTLSAIDAQSGLAQDLNSSFKGPK